MLGEARHGCPFPQEVRAHGGPEPRRARGESQQRQSLQVTRSGSVWKVAFGDTSTHVAIFIGERGRVFLNGCNFWLFPSKRNFSFLFLSPCLCFLHTSSVCTHGCARRPRNTRTCPHAERRTLGSTTTIPRLSVVDSCLSSMADRQTDRKAERGNGGKSLEEIVGWIIYFFLPT